MILDCIDSIIDGMKVFMPSGIEATIYKDDDKIVVEYRDKLDSYTDTYTQDEFGNLIKEGIVFNEPSQLVMESKLNENKIEAATRLEKIARKCKDVRIRQNASSLLDAMNLGVDVKDEVHKLFKEVDKMKEKNEGILCALSKELKEALNENDFSDKLTKEVYLKSKEKSVEELADDYGVPKEKIKKIILKGKSKVDNDLITESKKQRKNRLKEAYDARYTDINDLDFPDALADTVDVNEEGEVLSLSDIASQIAEIKTSLLDEINSLKAEVQALKDVAKPVEETEIIEPEENLEELAEVEDEEIEDDEQTEDEEIENEEIEEDEELQEDLNDTKKAIDKIVGTTKNTKEIKAAIDILTDNDKEEEDAKEYAIDKLKESLVQTSKTSKLSQILR